MNKSIRRDVRGTDSWISSTMTLNVVMSRNGGMWFIVVMVVVSGVTLQPSSLRGKCGRTCMITCTVGRCSSSQFDELSVHVAGEHNVFAVSAS